MSEFSVVRNFHFLKECRLGDIVELDSEQAKRFAHLVEPVNSTDTKPDKKYKKGRSKSK